MKPYVHGYSEKESCRLADQAGTLTELLHGDIAFPPGSRCWRPAAASAPRPSPCPDQVPTPASNAWIFRKSP